MGQSAECFYNHCNECITNNDCSCNCHTRVYSTLEVFNKSLIPNNYKRLLSQGTTYTDYNHNENKEIMKRSRGRPSKVKKDLQK